MRYLLMIFLLAISIKMLSQKRVIQSCIEISKTQYDSCNYIQKSVPDLLIKKQAGRLRIPIKTNHQKIFNDNNSTTNFIQYSYLGDIKELGFSLVEMEGYNDEEFYLINRSTGKVDTLIGMPIFANNHTDFVCINNPGTDKKQLIQVCEIRNNKVKTRDYLKGTSDTFFEAVNCVERTSIKLKDIKNRYWKINFTID